MWRVTAVASVRRGLLSCGAVSPPSTSTLRAFIDARGSSAEAITPERLDDLLEQARRAWPQLGLEPVDLAGALGAAVARGIEPERLDAAEVHLALACARQQPLGLRAFEAEYLSALGRLLRHMGLDDDELAEVAQATRRRLLLPKEDGTHRLLEYAGRGQLQALVRVVATRAALDQQRTRRRRREAPVQDLSAILLASADPERAAGQGRKRDVFRSAFEAAVAGLPAEDRTLLRMYVLDGVGLDGVAAVAGIHRSTAARRLARIRAAIADQTRLRLAGAGLGTTELDSVIGVVDQGLELTLSRILAETTGPDPA